MVLRITTLPGVHLPAAHFFPRAPDNEVVTAPAASTQTKPVTADSSCRPLVHPLYSPTSLAPIMVVECALHPDHLTRTLNLIGHVMDQIGIKDHDYMLSGAYDIKTHRFFLATSGHTQHKQIGIEFFEVNDRTFIDRYPPEKQKELWSSVGFVSFARPNDGRIVAFKIDTVKCPDSLEVRQALRTFFGDHWVDDRETLKELFNI